MTCSRVQRTFYVLLKRLVDHVVVSKAALKVDSCDAVKQVLQASCQLLEVTLWQVTSLPVDVLLAGPASHLIGVPLLKAILKPLVRVVFFVGFISSFQTRSQSRVCHGFGLLLPEKCVSKFVS